MIKLPVFLLSTLLMTSCSNAEKDPIDENVNNNPVSENNEVDSISIDEEVTKNEQKLSDYKLPKAPLSTYEDTSDPDTYDVLETNLIRIAQSPDNATKEDKLNAYREYREADQFARNELAEKLLPVADAKIAELKEKGYRFKLPIKKKSEGGYPYISSGAYMLADYDFNKKGFLINGCQMNSFTYPERLHNTLFIEESEISKAAPNGTSNLSEWGAVIDQNFGDNCYFFVEDQDLAKKIQENKTYQNEISGFVYFDVPFRDGEPKLLVQPVQADVDYTWKKAPELKDTISSRSLTWTE